MMGCVTEMVGEWGTFGLGPNAKNTGSPQVIQGFSSRNHYISQFICKLDCTPHSH